MNALPDRLQLGMIFDVASLEKDLAVLESHSWINHFVKQNYNGTWDVLPLRGTAGATHPVMMIYSDPSSTEFEDTPFLKEAPYLQEVLSRFECPLQSVRLMRLTPGSDIKEHCDHDLSAEFGQVRMHIPIKTNPNVDFLLNGVHVPMSPGTCWYLRLADPHAVRNRGDSDRIHLVIDARMNDWLAEQLQMAVGK